MKIQKASNPVRFGFLIIALLLLQFQAACFWKLWSKDEPLENKVFDVYGTVETVTKDKVVIQSKKGDMEFALVDSSIKGGDFGPGALVHVYYKNKGDVKEITMVVEKID